MNDRSGKIYRYQGYTFGRETYFVRSLDAAYTLAVLSDIEGYDIYKKFNQICRTKYRHTDVENIMKKIIDDSLVIKATISALFSSIVGSLVFLMCLSWGDNSTSVLGLIFTYFFIVMMSIIGTIMGSLIMGVPLLMISARFYPDATVKGSLFIVCSTIFMWLVVLAWPVTKIFEIHYSDVLLLSPYAFCSAFTLTYLTYWN